MRPSAIVPKLNFNHELRNARRERGPSHERAVVHIRAILCRERIDIFRTNRVTEIPYVSEAPCLHQRLVYLLFTAQAISSGIVDQDDVRCRNPAGEGEPLAIMRPVVAIEFFGGQAH